MTSCIILTPNWIINHIAISKVSKICIENQTSYQYNSPNSRTALRNSHHTLKDSASSHSNFKIKSFNPRRILIYRVVTTCCLCQNYSAPRKLWYLHWFVVNKVCDFRRFAVWDAINPKDWKKMSVFTPTGRHWKFTINRHFIFNFSSIKLHYLFCYLQKAVLPYHCFIFVLINMKVTQWRKHNLVKLNNS
jgi:hypothetical protein